MRPSFKQMDYCDTLYMVPLKIDGDFTMIGPAHQLESNMGKGSPRRTTKLSFCASYWLTVAQKYSTRKVSRSDVG